MTPPLMRPQATTRRLVSQFAAKHPPRQRALSSFFSSLSLPCDTCTCHAPSYCGTPPETHSELPPPLPEPKFSFRRRLLPPSLTPLASADGTRHLVQALQNGTAASYIPLTEQFVNQSDPAFCGVTTLMMVLNTLAIDPNVRWRGGWRFYGNESVLLDQCCFHEERIQRIGIHLEEFNRMAQCQGLSSKMYRPSAAATVDDFRRDVVEILTYQANDDTDNGVVVASFSRQALGQTGDGHFSPIAAYHEDKVLVLDVARFKYQPYWVSVEALYHSMQYLDEATQKPRGWFVLRPPVRSAQFTGTRIRDEGRRSAEVVPAVGEGYACPVHSVKAEYCSMNEKRGDAQKTL